MQKPVSGQKYCGARSRMGQIQQKNGVSSARRPLRKKKGIGTSDSFQDRSGNQMHKQNSKSTQITASVETEYHAENPNIPPSIIVYSGYRSSSTWFWSRLRKNSRLRCYYEVFHEILISASPEIIQNLRPSDWRSRHPDDAPYLLEYAPLLGEGPGIPGFPIAEEPGSRLVGRQGIDGPLDEDVHAYLELLLKSAWAQGQIPVITCTRMLALSAGIRRSFPSYHILLIRNLFRQWNSYSGQHRTGNSYFLHTLFQTTSLADRVPYIAYLSSIFKKEDMASFDAWVSEENYDRVFCYFISLHIYLLIHCSRSSDLIIDVNRLAEPSGAYRRDIECAIHDAVNVEIDLSDAGDDIDFPKHTLRSASSCTLFLQGLVAKACVVLGANDDERSLANKLLDDTWAEYERFSYYTRSAADALNVSANDARRTELRLLTAEDRVSAVEQERDALAADAQEHARRVSEELEAANRALQEAASQTDGLRADCALLEAKLATLSAERNAANDRVSAVEQERDALAADAQEHARRVSEELEAANRALQEAASQTDGLRADCALLEAKLVSLEAELDETHASLGRESIEKNDLAVERHRLYEELRLEGGPMALRRVLPLARILRPIIRFLGKVKWRF
nr:hypothetical protein [Sphingobium nicotianae]